MKPTHWIPDLLVLRTFLLPQEAQEQIAKKEDTGESTGSIRQNKDSEHYTISQNCIYTNENASPQ